MSNGSLGILSIQLSLKWATSPIYLKTISKMMNSKYTAQIPNSPLNFNLIKFWNLMFKGTPNLTNTNFYFYLKLPHCPMFQILVNSNIFYPLFQVKYVVSLFTPSGFLLAKQPIRKFYFSYFQNISSLTTNYASPSATSLVQFTILKLIFIFVLQPVHPEKIILLK